MITRIFLIRHGATVLTAEDRFAGATDVPLSDEGREQARRLALRLQAEEIAAIYASPLGRTMETARLIGAPHPLEVLPRDGLREISHGRWEGKTRDEVEAQFPEEAESGEKDPYTFAPVGGESGLAVGARAAHPFQRHVALRRGRSGDPGSARRAALEVVGRGGQAVEFARQKCRRARRRLFLRRLEPRIGEVEAVEDLVVIVVRCALVV